MLRSVLLIRCLSYWHQSLCAPCLPSPRFVCVAQEAKSWQRTLRPVYVSLDDTIQNSGPSVCQEWIQDLKVRKKSNSARGNVLQRYRKNLGNYNLPKTNTKLKAKTEPRPIGWGQVFISCKGRLLPRVLSFGFIYLFILFWSFGLKCLKKIIELRCGGIKKGIQLVLEDLMMSKNHPQIMIRWWLQWPYACM